MIRHFIFELQQGAAYPEKNVSIKSGRPTLAGKSSDNTGTTDYAGSTSRNDDKRQRPRGYGVKTTIIESISWQWLYAIHLLVAYELILTNKDAPVCLTPCLWLPSEAVFAVAWLLKSHWNPDSPLFNLIEQLKPTSTLRGGRPLAITIMITGSGDNPPQYPSSESSGQQALTATSHTVGSSAHLPCFDSGHGKGSPQQHSHTLGLNCFVHPCHGVCQFRPSGATPLHNLYPLSVKEHSLSCIDYFDSGITTHSMSAALTYIDDPHEPLNDDVPMPGNLSVNADDQIIIVGLLSLGGYSLAEGNGISSSGCFSSGAVTHLQQALSDHKKKYGIEQKICIVTVIGKDGQPRPCGTVCKSAQSLSSHKSRIHTGQRNCDATVIGESGQQRPCGKVCSNAQALLDHKRRHHSGKKTCYTITVGEDGQQRTCGKVYKSIKALTDHRSRFHSGRQTCGVTVVGENGQQRPCGTVCKNAQCLLSHKKRYHTGQQTCDVAVVGEDSQQRACGEICKSSKSLMDHKRRYHTGQKTCEVEVVGEDGQQWPCGKICRSAQALSDHKSKVHSGQQTCVATVVDENGQPRPCGKVCKNAQRLSYHKSKDHSRQKNCNVTIVGEDGRQYRCGKVCNNARALLDHKRMHRKRKPADVDQKG
ncbi:hypothetical protein [Endozoicomonas sp. SESOKO2]|uniref:hypothetical protein n=1 Tax=Endozoicomonas sp. SESOKO2 TaxID=2828743 RepID=UPI002147FA0D|nr:hypothetical protein [Endozoicomonas sp. SESOKO2]